MLRLVLLFIIFLINIKCFSQSSNNIDFFGDYSTRLNQLTQNQDSNYRSYTFRSSNDRHFIYNEKLKTYSVYVPKVIKDSLNRKISLAFESQLNLSTSNFNDWNNSTLLQLRGVQSLNSLKFIYSNSFLKLSFNPEFLVLNPFNYKQGSNLQPNQITYRKNIILPGQSSIYIQNKIIQFGYSNENLWWGTAYNNSLTLSNNAPGFLHFSLKTLNPINIGLGKLEFQIISGKLKSRNDLPFENYYDSTINPKSTGDRIINGMIFSIQPYFFKGFTFGVSRLIQFYSNDFKGGFFKKHLPILLTPLQRRNAQNDDLLVRDQQANIFFKYRIPTHKIEFYCEYGFNDYFYNVRDFLMSPSHSAAYILGIRKIVRNTDLTFEHLKMSPIDGLAERQGNGAWYWHYQISEGFTNMNQIVASSPGIGVSTLSFSIIPNINKPNFKLMLYTMKRNPFLKGLTWYDQGIEVSYLKHFNKITLFFKFTISTSQNQQWVLGNSGLNVLGRVGLNYKLL